MSVKRSRSASRVLTVLEAIARHQPVGVSELARLIDDDKSAVQRAIMTLADEGWIQSAPGTTTRWRLTGHIHAVAHMAHGGDDLRQRARAVMEALRDEVGESILLTVPDRGHFVVIDVVESRQLLRTAPQVGMIVDVLDSATGQAVLAFLPKERQIELLGAPPEPALAAEFERNRDRGFSVSEGDLIGGSVNIASPIFEADGQAAGAIVVSAPRERLTAEHHERAGKLAAQAARELSRGAPASPQPTKMRAQALA